MSWLTHDKVVKTENIIGQVGVIAGPIISLFNAPLGAIISRVSGAMVQVEATITTPQAGTVKSQAVMGDFEAGLALAQAKEAEQGRTLTYDRDKLAAFITAQNTAYNLAAEFNDTFKLVSLAK